MLHIQFSWAIKVMDKTSQWCMLICTVNGLINPNYRGTQRQFLENICSEDDLRSRIFGTFVVKFLACLPACPRIFEHLKNGILLPIFNGIFTLKRSPRIFASLFSG